MDPQTSSRTKESKSVEAASPSQIFRWKFLKHRLAVVSLAILAVMYLMATFAEFVAPYDPYSIQSTLVLAQVLAELALELSTEMLYHAIIKILASQVGISRCCFHLEDAFFDCQK
jgi:ABC-type dipeptide/oligopeptide/nickel transport system permease subunit